jgi:hypothetical protein
MISGFANWLKLGWAGQGEYPPFVQEGTGIVGVLFKPGTR